MDKNKVKLTICGTEYTIASDDNYDYVVSVGEKVDQKIKEILEKSPKISVSMASVLATLEYCDYANKSELKVATLRGQIKDYIDEIAELNKQKEMLQSKLLDFEKLNRELNLKRKKVEELEAQATKYSGDIKNFQTKYKGVCLDLENMQNKIDELNLIIKDTEKTKAQLDKCTIDLEKLKNIHSAVLSELEDAKLEIDNLNSQNKCAHDEFAGMTQNLENEICSLQEKLNSQKLGDPVQELVTFSDNYLEVAPVDFLPSVF